MRRITLSLGLMALLACGAFAAGGEVLHVGEPGATAENIAKAVKAYGKVAAKLDNGFFKVVLRPGISLASARKGIQRAGVEHVFDASAGQVDPSSLPSVRNYIAYVKARNEIRGGEHVKGTKLKEGEEEENGLDFYEALEYYLAARVGPDGKIDQTALNRAISQREALPPATPPSWRNGDSNAPAGGWVHQGPTNLDIPYSTYYGLKPLSGRKQGICVAPSNANYIYVASAGGGIWKSTDAGVNWTACSDSWAFLHTNSIAVHPTNPNIIYAGTGDYVGFFNKQTMGVMKSSDGGVTWTQLGSPHMRDRVITDIIIEPTNTNIITVGTGTSPASGNDLANSGVYRSTDGGLTWNQITSGHNVDDLERGPTGIYWMAGTINASPGVIMVSNNAGASFTLCTHPNSGVNQPAMDIAPSRTNASTVYALTCGDENIWKSTNGGGSWSSIKGGTFPNGYSGNANYNWSQKNYDYWIGTSSHAGADVVYVGLITTAQWTSTTGTWIDCGRSWQQSAPNFQHSDQHCYANHPTSEDTMYFGCDGGIFRYTYSTAPTAANWAPLNAKIKDHQCYSMAAHPTDALYLMAGLQDNSSPASRGNLASWANLYAGDGGWPAFDKVSPGVHYTSWQFGNIARYPTATSTSPVVLTGSGWSTQFIAPYVVGGNGSQVYGGHDRVRRWTSLATPTVWTDVTGLIGGTATTMTVAPTNNNSMYVGSSTGTIWRTADAWANETQIDDAHIDRQVGGLAASYTNINDVVCGLQGGSNGNPRLWRCTNTAAASPVWANISGSGGSSQLPDVPVNCVTFDPYDSNRIYVGTDIGAFMTTNGGATWANMNVLGLPNVHVNALVVNAAKTYLYAGTYGRGIWRIPLGSAPSFSISGTVFQLGGVTGLSGATMTLQKWNTISTSVSVSPGAPIPDNSATGVTANVVSAINTPLDNIQVFVNCTHTWRGDLTVDLVAPDGRVAHLKTFNGSDSADNVIAYYDATNTFRGYKPAGTWKVIVRDLASGDTGTFVKTVVYFRYNGWQLQTTQVTPVAGTYSFTGLAAGKYWWYPTKSGKTFTPGSKVSTVGPSLTGQNFTANQ